MGRGNAVTVRLGSAAYDKYWEHEQAGHDMAEAGEELSHAVCRIVDPPICSMPRDEVLEARLATYYTPGDEYTDDDYTDDDQPPKADDDNPYGYRDYRP